MSRSLVVRGALVVALMASFPLAFSADPARHGPAYTADGRLIPPADYREWVYLSSGIDMSYDPNAVASADPVFDNVFADPASYRVFLATGTWPDKTQLVSEVRASSGKGSINHRGHFQNGEVVGIDVHIKDVKRFAGGWAFFQVEGKTPVAQLPTTEDCYACHQQHAAVDTTFVQFYPTLLPIAERKATLSPAYLEARRVLDRPR